MTTDEKLQLLHSAYNEAVRTGRISSKKEFAELLGVNRSGLTSAMNGAEKNLTDSLVSKAIAAVSGNNVNLTNSPHSNVATGHGHISIHAESSEASTRSGSLPLIPQNIYKETDTDVAEFIASRPVSTSPAVQQFPQASCYYTVASDAMAPAFCQGDMLALKRVRDDAPIVNGEVYAVNSSDLGLILRFVYDRGDTLELRSDPRAERYEPFKVRKDTIFALYRIVGLIRTNL